jgi:hypothetical protein
MTEEEFKTGKKNKSKSLVAKKDFHSRFNDLLITIKEGDDVEKMNLPDVILTNLKTEGVL